MKARAKICLTRVLGHVLGGSCPQPGNLDSPCFIAGGEPTCLKLRLEGLGLKANLRPRGLISGIKSTRLILRLECLRLKADLRAGCLIPR